MSGPAWGRTAGGGRAKPAKPGHDDDGTSFVNGSFDWAAGIILAIVAEQATIDI